MLVTRSINPEELLIFNPAGEALNVPPVCPVTLNTVDPEVQNIPPFIVAIGNGFIVTVALPLCPCEQVVEEASCTLTRVYKKVPGALVGAATVTELPDVAITV